MNNTDRNIKPISPFILFCQKVIPLAFDESMSYYECLCALVNYLYNEVTPAINNNADAVTKLQTYVANYFKNLDIQEEINNKLDEMAESGQLADIIAQYLKLNGVLAFNTVADLINATNIVDGSITRTIGLNTYNDGKGSYYKIRPLTTSDVIDGVNIIALNFSETLIAEKIHDYYVNELQQQTDTLTNRLNLITNKKIIFIGDSYAQGYSPDGSVTSWVTLMNNRLNLTNSIIKSYGGTGFVNTVDNKNFITMLNEIENDDEVTDIIVCGGYNDIGHIADIENGITNFKNSANTKFPNAKIHIGAIGWTQNSASIYALAQVINQYNQSAKKLNIHYLKNCEYSLHEYGFCFSSDNIHPNQYGQNRLADNIIQAFLYGSCSVIHDYANIIIENLNSNVSSQTFTNSLGATFNNGVVEVSVQNASQILITTPFTLDSGGLDFKLGDIKLKGGSKSYIIGSNYYYNIGRLDIIFRTTEYKYYKTTGYFYINNKDLHIVIPPMINDARNNYLNVSVDQIQIGGGSHFTSDALMC